MKKIFMTFAVLATIVAVSACGNKSAKSEEALSANAEMECCDDSSCQKESDECKNECGECQNESGKCQKESCDSSSCKHAAESEAEEVAE